MPKDTSSKSSSRASKELLKFSYKGKHVLLPRPDTYQDALRAAHKRFDPKFHHPLTLKTIDLLICGGVPAELCEDSWEIAKDELRTILVEVDDDDDTDSGSESGYSLRAVARVSGRDMARCAVQPVFSGSRIRILELSGRQLEVPYEPSSTIDNVKSRLQDITGLCPDSQRLIYEGRQLEDGRTLSDYGVERDDTLHLIERLKGGKPVIYLQAPEEVNATVRLSLVPSWQFSAIYPMVPVKTLQDGQGQELKWSVLTRKDGSLLDHSSGAEVAYLYWEALADKKPLMSPPPSPTLDGPQDYFEPSSPSISPDDSVVLSVKGNMTAYLERSLTSLGLHTEARTSFITYWLPSFLKHENVAIRFVDQKAYERAAPMNVSPKPDVVTRIFMLFKGISQEEIRAKYWSKATARTEEDVSIWQDIVGADFAKAKDEALFRVLEWGGMEII